MQPTQVYYNTQSHATHSLKVYIATQYTKKDVIWGKRQKEQPKAGLWLNANHRLFPISGQKATTKVCGCNRRFSRVCALAVGGAQATTRAILSGETCYKS